VRRPCSVPLRCGMVALVISSMMIYVVCDSTECLNEHLCVVQNLCGAIQRMMRMVVELLCMPKSAQGRL